MPEKEKNNIIYGFHTSPFGAILIACINNKICHLSFVDNNKGEVLNDLKNLFSNNNFIEDTPQTKKIADDVFNVDNKNTSQPIYLLAGTDFQLKVWTFLCTIPEGHVVSYEDVAVGIGKPKAIRAVANAIANNKIAFLIPCHRVITKSGKIGGYKWGEARKKKILAWEGVNIL